MRVKLVQYGPDFLFQFRSAASLTLRKTFCTRTRQTRQKNARTSRPRLSDVLGEGQPWSRLDLQCADQRRCVTPNLVAVKIFKKPHSC